MNHDFVMLAQFGIKSICCWVSLRLGSFSKLVRVPCKGPVSIRVPYDLGDQKRGP